MNSIHLFSHLSFFTFNNRVKQLKTEAEFCENVSAERGAPVQISICNIYNFIV